MAEIANEVHKQPPFRSWRSVAGMRALAYILSKLHPADVLVDKPIDTCLMTIGYKKSDAGNGQTVILLNLPSLLELEQPQNQGALSCLLLSNHASISSRWETAS